MTVRPWPHTALGATQACTVPFRGDVRAPRQASSAGAALRRCRWFAPALRSSCSASGCVAGLRSTSAPACYPSERHHVFGSFSDQAWPSARLSDSRTLGRLHWESIQTTARAVRLRRWLLLRRSQRDRSAWVPTVAPRQQVRDGYRADFAVESRASQGSSRPPGGSGTGQRRPVRHPRQQRSRPQLSTSSATARPMTTSSAQCHYGEVAHVDAGHNLPATPCRLPPQCYALYVRALISAVKPTSISSRSTHRGYIRRNDPPVAAPGRCTDGLTARSGPSVRQSERVGVTRGPRSWWPRSSRRSWIGWDSVARQNPPSGSGRAVVDPHARPNHDASRIETRFHHGPSRFRRRRAVRSLARLGVHGGAHDTGSGPGLTSSRYTRT